MKSRTLTARLCTGIGMALLLAGCGGPAHSPAMARSGGKAKAGAFATGHYRNLFTERGYSAEAVHEKINAVYQQLFHGDPTTQAVCFPAGSNSNGPLAFISDIKHKDVRTEGMSYGMMISVQLDHKAEFDAIWNWAKTCMYNGSPAHPSYGFFSWSLRTNAALNSDLVAPDGEEYFVMALYFAAHRWGSGSGIYDYQREADQLLTRMRHREPITGRTRRGVVTAGPLFNPEHKMVRFSPSSEVPDHTDPSYHLPAFYELWSRWGPAADRDFWKGAAAASRDFFQRATHPATGLAPDYARFDGTPYAGAWTNRHADQFRYDAWRTAMNWSVDWAWWAQDPRECDLSDRLQAFFAAKGLDEYGCLFTLDGRALSPDHSPGLVAMNAVASLAATNPRAGRFVDALWNTPVPDGIERYYDGLLYLMGLMHCGGEFRIWEPR